MKRTLVTSLGTVAAFPADTRPSRYKMRKRQIVEVRKIA